MKTIIAIIAIVLCAATLQAQGLNSRIASAEPKSQKYIWVTLSTGTAVQGVSTNLLFTSATFYGYKAVANNAGATANTASTSIGFVDSAGAVVTANQPAFVDTITAGSWLSLGKTGTKYNLSEIYFLGTTGDKILVVYEQ